MQNSFMLMLTKRVEIVGGEQYILSAVMHADERNRAMSEALGEDVYHYHLHVVYIPVVEKQILWSKRCKDEASGEPLRRSSHRSAAVRNGSLSRCLTRTVIQC